MLSARVRTWHATAHLYEAEAVHIGAENRLTLTAWQYGSVSSDCGEIAYHKPPQSSHNDRHRPHLLC